MLRKKIKRKSCTLKKNGAENFNGQNFWISTAIIYSVCILQHRRPDCLTFYRVLSAITKSLGSWQKMSPSPGIYGTSSSRTFERSSLPMVFSLSTIASLKKMYYPLNLNSRIHQAYSFINNSGYRNIFRVGVRMLLSLFIPTKRF